MLSAKGSTMSGKISLNHVLSVANKLTSGNPIRFSSRILLFAYTSVAIFGWIGSVGAAQELKPIDFQQWRLPDIAPSPSSNKLDEKKAELGKRLFFDPRLSGTGKMSCATCHDPAKGWSDGLPTARGHKGKILARATPTIVNVGFNKILMWDGREKSLEDQALGPIVNPEEMANSVDNVIRTLKGIPGYVDAFKEAYYGLPINASTISRSIAMYQRLVVANQSPFDRWLAGDTEAMTAEQLAGLKVFVDPNKGNCASCHRPPNFTDNGFHNIGLKSFGNKKPDLGRHRVVSVDMTKGAFKTPPLRNISLTSPYFHDGSAKSLNDVINHYMSGGVVKSNLSPNMKTLKINQAERKALLAFLNALTSHTDPTLAEFSLP